MNIIGTTAYFPPPKMRDKGFPIIIRNKTGGKLIITNIKLRTIIDPPKVPLLLTKRFFDENEPSFHGFNVDELIDLPIEIEARKEHILYIP